jgi:pyrroline-5-carboxylate reductase
MAFSYALASLGAGNMAEGILAAVIARGLYPPASILVSDPAAERCAFFRDQFGIASAPDNRRLVADSQRILLAVKPQMFDAVAAEIAGQVTKDHLFISIMAGKSTRTVAAALGGTARVVRGMPNLPIRVGAGMAGICGGREATSSDLAEVQAIFNAGGGSVIVKDETLMDAVTAVSGSGPAYFYFVVEAMVEGGKACGLSEAEALDLARYTCLGAGRMMLETGEPPADLRAKVTSKGGTTLAALDSLRASGADRAIRDAVIAAFRRARELGS